MIPGEGHLHNRSPLGHDATPSQRQRGLPGRDDLRQDVVGFYGMIYPLVNVHITMENHHQNNEFFPSKMVDLSIVM